MPASAVPSAIEEKQEIYDGKRKGSTIKAKRVVELFKKEDLAKKEAQAFGKLLVADDIKYDKLIEKGGSTSTVTGVWFRACSGDRSPSSRFVCSSLSGVPSISAL